MPRRKPSTVEPQGTSVVAQPHVIDPRGVYTIPIVRSAFGFKLSTIRNAWRKQGLKISRRAGRVYILGQWLIDWLEAGVSEPKRKREGIA